MSRIIFKNFHELHELENNPRFTLRKNLRELVKILIIDDEDFVYYEALKQSKFNVTHIKTIEDLHAAAEYDIVICDIVGVGKAFKSKNGGAFVVNEIKKLYPYKQYAVYSGSAYNFEQTNLLRDIETIKKDADLEQWISYLDEFIERKTSPIFVWKNLRTILLDRGTSAICVAKLESEYVNIVQTSPIKLKDFHQRESCLDLSPDIRGIIQSLIAGVILALCGI